MDLRQRFKMYKAGKQWVVAGIAVTATALALVGMGSQPQSVVAATTTAATSAVTPATSSFAINTSAPSIIAQKDSSQEAVYNSIQNESTMTVTNKNTGQTSTIPLSTINGQNFVIDRDTASTISFTFKLTNTGSTPESVHDITLFPNANTNRGPAGILVDKSMPAGPLTLTTSGGANASDFGIQYTANPGDYKPYSDFMAANPGFTWDQLKGLDIESLSGKTLAPGQSVSVTVPFVLSADASADNAQAVFGNYTYDIANPPTTSSNGRVASQIARPTFDTTDPYTLSQITSRNADGSQTAIVLNKEDPFVDPQGSQNSTVPTPQPSDYQAFNFAPGDGMSSTLYSGYEYQVDLTNLQKYLNSRGYAIEYSPNTNKQSTNYTYDTVGGIKHATDYTEDGSAVTPGETANLGQVVFVNQIIKASDSTLPVGGTWDPTKNVTANDHTGTAGLTGNNLLNDPGFTITYTDATGHPVSTVDTSKDGTFHVTYTYKNDSLGLDITKTVTVTVGQGSTSGGNTGGNGGSTVNPGNGASSSNSSSSTGSTTKPSTGNNTATSSVAKGTAVYATKTIYLYKNPTFKASQRIVKYSKQTRPNRPMFVVTGTAKSKNGVLRYKVKDVNHMSATDGKTGYITANKNYVLPVYYATKHSTVKVIAKTGLNSYKTVKQTGKVKHYKKGTTLKVAKIVKHNLTTRFVLTNGHYITANKKFVIAE